MGNVISNELRRLAAYLDKRSEIKAKQKQQEKTRTVFCGIVSNYKSRHINNSLEQDIQAHKYVIYAFAKGCLPNDRQAVTSHYALLRIPGANYWYSHAYLFMTKYIVAPNHPKTLLARVTLVSIIERG